MQSDDQLNEAMTKLTKIVESDSNITTYLSPTDKNAKTRPNYSQTSKDDEFTEKDEKRLKRLNKQLSDIDRLESLICASIDDIWKNRGLLPKKGDLTKLWRTDASHCKLKSDEIIDKMIREQKLKVIYSKNMRAFVFTMETYNLAQRNGMLERFYEKIDNEDSQARKSAQKQRDQWRKKIFAKNVSRRAKEGVYSKRMLKKALEGKKLKADLEAKEIEREEKELGPVNFTESKENEEKEFLGIDGL